MKKNILHLCADLGSDSWYYQQDEDYNVIRVGAEIGVENYTPDFPVHGIIANPRMHRVFNRCRLPHNAGFRKGYVPCKSLPENNSRDKPHLLGDRKPGKRKIERVFR